MKAQQTPVKWLLALHKKQGFLFYDDFKQALKMEKLQEDAIQERTKNT
jgi:hypothetical protein